MPTNVEVISKKVISNYELERGKPIPSKNHAIIQLNIIRFFIINYGPKFDSLPELSLQMDGYVKVPDIAIYKSMEFVANDDEIKVETPPLCAIEILSPTQNITELTSKCADYFEFGVKSYWLVIPALRSIFVFENAEQHQVFSNTDLLKDEQLGIEVDLGAIFSKNFNQYQNR